MRIAIDEASGPVSPRFQYRFTIVIGATTDGEITIHSTKGPLGTRDESRALDDAAVAELEKKLGALALQDLVDEERERRVGVRVNTLTVGDRAVRYLASDLTDDDATPGQRALREARDAILQVAR